MLATCLSDADTEAIEIIKDAFHHPAHVFISLEGACILRALINSAFKKYLRIV